MKRAWMTLTSALLAGVLQMFLLSPATAQEAAPRGPTLGKPANARSDSPTLGRPANASRTAQPFAPQDDELVRGSSSGEVQQAVFPPHPMNHGLSHRPWAQKHLFWEHNSTLHGSWRHPYAQPGPAWHTGVVTGPILTGPIGTICCDPAPPVCDPCPPLCCEPIPCIDPCLPCDNGWCCPPPDYRGPPSYIYGSAEYLHWWVKEFHVPALVTTSFDPEDLGVLGEPSTEILLGDGPLDLRSQSGGRFTVGVFLEPCHLWAMEGSYFFLGKEEQTERFSSTGIPVLARPFFNVDDFIEDAQLVANPPLPNVFPLEGSVDVRVTTEMQGAEANFIRNLCYGSNPVWCKTYHVDFLFGYRWIDLKESLVIHEDLRVPETTVIETPDGDVTILEGTRFVVHDAFLTRNSFHGGQIGLRGEMRWGKFFFDGRAKIAFGNVHSRVDIRGFTITSIPGQGSTFDEGGLLALPTNIGTYRRDTFSVVPELGANIGFQLCSWCRLYAGYTAIYWTNVVRPGHAIDRNVNPTQLPGANGLSGDPRPQFKFRDSGFWVQGVNFGVEFRY